LEKSSAHRPRKKARRGQRRKKCQRKTISTQNEERSLSLRRNEDFLSGCGRGGSPKGEKRD